MIDILPFVLVQLVSVSIFLFKGRLKVLVCSSLKFDFQDLVLIYWFSQITWFVEILFLPLLVLSEQQFLVRFQLNLVFEVLFILLKRECSSFFLIQVLLCTSVSSELHFIISLNKVLFWFITNVKVHISYALFDMDGSQVPPEVVTKVGKTFETILKEVS